MSIYKLFKTSKKLEKDGVVIDYGPNEDIPPAKPGEPHPSMSFRLARAGGANQNFAKALEQATKPYKKMIQTGNLSNDIANKLYRDAFIAHVLLGWENVTNEAKELVAFGKDAAERLFTDLPDLFNDLKEQSQNIALYREEVLEEDLGNSGGSSSTDSSKAP